MTGVPARPTAVSLTTLPLEADSRAFRIACSLADAGFRSILVEGRPSVRQFWGDRIEVRSIGRGGSGPSGTGNGLVAVGSRFRRMTAALRAGQIGAVGELPLYLGYRGYEWWRYCRRPRHRLPSADLYYLHSFEMHRAVAAAAARLGASVVYDAHDYYRGIEPVELQRAFDRNRLRPFLDRLENRLVAAADGVVTVSEGVARLMEHTFGRRPVVIRNCHDDRLDRPVVSDLRMVLGLTGEDRLCVVVGNRKAGMAVEIAADAMALLPGNFHLAFLGRFYEGQAETLRRHPAAGRIHFGHCVAPDQVVPFIRSADLGLVIYEPRSDNYRNALPNGFFQVVAAGLPIIRAPLAEVEATIGGHKVGSVLDRLDPGELARAIARCSQVLETLRLNTAALARELRWETEAVRLRDLIEGAMLARTAGRGRSCSGPTRKNLPH